jgi:NAD(P)-dependent dehydrogenase (short-subunit alcohol dehydrogenase family)
MLSCWSDQQMVRQGVCMNELNFSGHTALITGGAQGIGKEIVFALLENGAEVIAADINESALKEISIEAEKKDLAARFHSYCLDVSNVKDIETVASYAEHRLNGIDILVNNAGILHSTPIDDITEEEWDRIININLKSVFFMTQKVLPSMKKKNWGRVINMSSLAGRMGGYANGLAYSASKSGIIGLSRGMATRLAEFNITVNCIAPGTTESSLIQNFSDEKKLELQNMIPLGRLGKPRDIASLVLFLASDMAEFVTGATIDINGGMYLG